MAFNTSFSELKKKKKEMKEIELELGGKNMVFSPEKRRLGGHI